MLPLRTGIHVRALRAPSGTRARAACVCRAKAYVR